MLDAMLTSTGNRVNLRTDTIKKSMEVAKDVEKMNLNSEVVKKDIKKASVRKLKELIPRQMFQVPVQAAIGGKIVANCVAFSFHWD